MKVVRGKRLRATKVDRCGLPLAGEGSSLVTSGFVSVTYTPNMEEGEDLTQKNADGKNCVVDRTEPDMKWVDVSAVLCEVDVELLAMMTNLPQVLDYADRPTGFRMSKNVDLATGVALEVWSGTAGDECDTPLDDSILDLDEPLANYGYWLAPAIVEGTIGEIEIAASVATFTLTGRAVSGPRWGRGPYEVVATDAQNTAGRLLTPLTKDDFVHVDEVTIAPPAVTEGAVELTLPTPYFGDSGSGEG